jgi:hypothetical protein
MTILACYCNDHDQCLLHYNQIHVYRMNNDIEMQSNYILETVGMTFKLSRGISYPKRAPILPLAPARSFRPR